jgi:hypothetical protein
MINPLKAITKVLHETTDMVNAGKHLAHAVCPKIDIK